MEELLQVPHVTNSFFRQESTVLIKKADRDLPKDTQCGSQHISWKSEVLEVSIFFKHFCNQILTKKRSRAM